MSKDTILIGHGAGGKLSHNLIRNLFVKHFKNKFLDKLGDSSVVKTSSLTAFTTDSYVVDPLFFPGGDIGKLAVCGTVNDLLVSGAVPQYLSAGFIIEEGLPIDTLELIVKSMAKEARNANVEIITGDTKVVKKGQCDKLFINTAGIGKSMELASHLWARPDYKPGDKIIVSGNLGDHAITILAARNNIKFEQEVISDVASLNNLIIPLLEDYSASVKFMRDITRGGLATILNEVTENKPFGIELIEADLPIRNEVMGICEIFGYDPLYLANEGKIMLIVEENAANAVLEKMRSIELGKNAAIVGNITKIGAGRVSQQSVIGGSRIVDMLSGEMLPRIC
jgi:hydrogenase expression/formation protein HypE